MNREQANKGRIVVVFPSPRGGWAVQRVGNVRPSRVKATRDQAVNIGAFFAKEAGTRLVLCSSHVEALTVLERDAEDDAIQT